MRGLPDGGVHDEDDVIGGDGRGHLAHFLEQLRLLLVPPRRVDNDDLVRLLLEVLHALLRHLGAPHCEAREEGSARRTLTGSVSV